jgi:hypothetical protein
MAIVASGSESVFSCGWSYALTVNEPRQSRTVPAPIAVVVVLVYRLLSFWLPTLAGIALVLCFEHPHPNRLEAASNGRHDLS